jgi:hypothetical protein
MIGAVIRNHRDIQMYLLGAIVMERDRGEIRIER